MLTALSDEDKQQRDQNYSCHGQLNQLMQVRITLPLHQVCKMFSLLLQTHIESQFVQKIDGFKLDRLDNCIRFLFDTKLHQLIRTNMVFANRLLHFITELKIETFLNRATQISKTLYLQMEIIAYSTLFLPKSFLEP